MPAELTEAADDRYRIDWTIQDYAYWADEREWLGGGDGKGLDEAAIAERTFEAQLRHAADMIHDNITTHRHFADDCGDYLTSALDLAGLLAGARTGGHGRGDTVDTSDLMRALKGLAEVKEIDFSTSADDKVDDEGTYSPWVSMTVNLDYACDGVCSEVYEWCENNAWSSDPGTTQVLELIRAGKYTEAEKLAKELDMLQTLTEPTGTE